MILHKNEKRVVTEYKPTFQTIELKSPEKKRAENSIASDMAVYLMKLVLLYAVLLL